MDRSRWQAVLPGLVSDVAERWSLRLGEPFASGTGSFAVPVTTADGAAAVLKVGFPHTEARDEAAGLEAWNGHGAVRLLARDTAGPAAALLIELCEPGIPLAVALPPEAQDEVIAALATRLWIEPAAPHPFRPLAVMCEQWAAEFERDFAAAGDRGEPRLDPGLARAGARLFRELPATAPDRAVLLVTDLHPGNVLAARREPWLVIDPKPYIGDPACDALQHMINFPERLSAGPGRFADRMADLLDVDAGRLALWLFARCVMESVADPALRHAAVLLAP
jgi:streptomycin 6-kinase